MGNLYVWGDYSDFEDIPEAPVQIPGQWASGAIGRYCGAFIATDGSLWTWGSQNTYGQLCDGTFSNKTSDTFLQISTDQWVKVVGGNNFFLALKSNGTLWGWGRNNVGQLAQGDFTNRNSLVQITGTWNDIAVLADMDLCVATSSAGKVYQWGYTTNTATLTDESQSWQKVSASVDRFYSIPSDMTLWGIVLSGDYSYEVEITNAWEKLSSGFTHLLSIDYSKFLWSRGNNDYGEVGHSASEVMVQIGSDTWISVSAGSNSNSIGVNEEGRVFGWGRNQYENTIPGSTSNVATPTEIDTLPDEVFAGVYAGYYASLVWTSVEAPFWTNFYRQTETAG